MKPKLTAILIIGVLALSMVVTLVGAVGQVVSDDTGGPVSGQGLGTAHLTDTGTGTEIGEGSGDGALVRSFNFVCPFH